jgi:Asp-tRNA(Asn)/Glu-tRNA(Gln) amidotransferase A subunit family amidase
MDRRFFLGGTVAALALPDISVGSRSSSVDELTLADIAAAFTTARLTSHRLTTLYIDRIAARNRVGPLTRSVRDAAVMLGVMAGPDAADAASVAAGDKFEPDYVSFLDPQGLRGARLGIARRFFADNAPLDCVLDDCLGLLQAAAAQEVLLYEFKADALSGSKMTPNVA